MALAGGLLVLAGCTGSTQGQSEPSADADLSDHAADEPELVVLPDTSVEDGDDLDVQASGFSEVGLVAIAICTGQSTGGKAEYCDSASLSVHEPDLDGRVDVRLTARRLLQLSSGTADCTVTECFVVATDVEDLDHSVARQLVFSEADEVDGRHAPTVSVTPIDELESVAHWEVRLEGFLIGETLRPVVCAGTGAPAERRCDWERAGPGFAIDSGDQTVTVPVWNSFQPEGSIESVSCDTGDCRLLVLGADGEVVADLSLDD